MKKLLVIAILALSLFVEGCGTTIKYAPPSRRHIKPMLEGSVAVLQTKINTPSGDVFLDDMLRGKDIWRINDYQKVLTESIASAMEFSGIAGRAKAMSSSAENLTGWMKSSEAQGFNYVLVPELTRWHGYQGVDPVTFINPLSLLSFFGLHTVPGVFKAQAALNIQIIDISNGETIMMAAPEMAYSWTGAINAYSHFVVRPEFMMEFQRRFMDAVREDLEARALLYSADGTVVPYDWKIQARQVR